MSNTNWRELFEAYRTGDLSDDQRKSMEYAMEQDDDLRAEYELFVAIQEGLDNERIRNKLRSIRKSPKNNNGKNFNGFNSLLLIVIIAGLCVFAYKIIIDRPADASEIEESNIPEAAPIQHPPTDSITPNGSPSSSTQIEQKKEKTEIQPPIASSVSTKERETIDNLSEELVARYLTETEITKPLMRGGTQSASDLADRARKNLKAKNYTASIKLLKEEGETQGIHPDDKLWFLSLAYLGNRDLVKAKKSLEEIASDDFNTHHKMAAKLLSEIESL